MLSSLHETLRIFSLGLCLLAAALFLGCSTTSTANSISASTAAKTPTFLDHPVNGTTGTPADRDAINASNQQMYNAERANIQGTTPTTTVTPYQGIP
jgi:hypothetical protein